MFDTIVIGAGSGGLTTALGLAGLGKKVLLIEKHKMGGDCTNYGCIPSKSLIKYGKEASVLKKYDFDISENFSKKGLEGTREKVSEVLSHETPEVLMEKYPSLKVIKGEAKFVDKKTIEVNGNKYKSEKIVIATGSEPRKIEIDGLDDKHVLTNKSVFDLENVPQKLLVIGGGVIACELGEAFANLGSEVNLVVRGDRLLSNNESEISEYVLKKLMQKGVNVYFDSEIEKVEKKVAHIGKKKVDFDKVLMAVGRVVDASGLGLENAGVEYDKKGIHTDEKNRTSTRGIYAVGDVSSNDKLTHNADHQGRNVVKDILSRFLPQDKKVMPKVVYMQDEVASIGLNYEEAVKKYAENEIFKIELDFNRVDRSITDEASGKAIFIVKGVSGKIVGANIAGPRAGELISVIAVAMDNGIGLRKLSSSIYAYPTYSRIFKKAGDEFLRILSKEWKNYLKFVLKSTAPKILGALFWLGLIIGFVRYKQINDLSNLEIAQNLFEYFSNPDLTAAGIYILIYTLRPIILFPATLLTVMSGAVFGPIYGVIYTVIGANLSASVAYALGRFLGGDFVKGSGEGLLSKWKNKLQDNSFETVLTMRLIYLPFDGVNYLCGLLKIKWIQYALATLIGTIPGSMTFVVFGSSIDFGGFDLSMVSLEPRLLIVSAVLFVAGLGIAKLVRKKAGIKK